MTNYAHCIIVWFFRPCYDKNEAKKTVREFMDHRENCVDQNSALHEKTAAYMDKYNNRVGTDIWYRLVKIVLAVWN